MHADLQRLIALQAHDLEARRLREQLAGLPRRLQSAEAALKQAEAAAAQAHAALGKEEALRRRLESDIDDRRNKIARLRKQMDAAVSAAQITALEHEIQFAEKAIAAAEDEELASLDRTDHAEAALASSRKSVDQATAALTAERESAALLSAKNAEAIAALETERSTLRAAIPESLLFTYDRVSKARGTGVSEGVDHKCSACQMMVRPQRWNDLTDRSNHDAIFTCETCGRILYWDPRRDAPVDWKPGQVTETP